MGETPVTFITFLGQREDDTRLVVMGTPEELLARLMQRTCENERRM
jgi:hypothetical protein